eukprot:COSAG02_NODE_75193_length_148_cov_87.918367_1_plen_39_part_10
MVNEWADSDSIKCGAASAEPKRDHSLPLAETATPGVAPP